MHLRLAKGKATASAVGVIGYQLLQVVYWMSLATWLGGVLFVVMVAPVILRVLREARPILPEVLAVNLNHQHDTLLAGTLMTQIFALIGRVQFMCAGVLAGSMAIQTMLIDLGSTNGTAAIIRAALLISASAVAIYEQRVLWPAIRKERQTYIDHADEPEIANPAKDAFDRLQERAIVVLLVVISLLIGLVMFSANISPKSAVLPAAPQATGLSR